MPLKSLPKKQGQWTEPLAITELRTMKAWGIVSKSEWYNLPKWERLEKIALEMIDGEIQSHHQWQQEKDAKMKRGRK